MKYLHPHQAASASAHVESALPGAVRRAGAGSALAVLLAGLMSACAYTKPEPAPMADEAKAAPAKVEVPAPAPVPQAPAPKLPTAAEAALAEGLKAYQAGQYRQAETQLKAALQASSQAGSTGGLSAPADVANAHKHLAFIYCTSKRDSLCAAAFKAAKAADASFALTKAEAGHPMWANTYKKALGLK